MEPRFGHDFSNVRVHTDTPAADASHVLNAKAFTNTQHIFFGAGRFVRTGERVRRDLDDEATSEQYVEDFPATGLVASPILVFYNLAVAALGERMIHRDLDGVAHVLVERLLTVLPLAF